MPRKYKPTGNPVGRPRTGRKKPISEEQRIKNNAASMDQYYWKRSAHLADKCCAACGSEKDLEVDHIEPVKDQHRFWTCSWETIELRLVGTQILCTPCHKIKTKKFDIPRKVFECGTSGKYKQGCKCVPCKKANAERVAAYRAAKKAA